MSITNDNIKSWPIKNEIELKAEEILRFCQRKTGVDYLTKGVPIEEYIEGPLGILLEVEDLSYLGERVVGAVYLAEKTIKISPKIEHHEGLYRFTLAHECAHMFLDDDCGDTIIYDTDSVLSYNFKQEVRVNEFASYLLMPWNLIDSALMGCCNKWDMYPPITHIQMLWGDTKRSRWLWKRRFLPYLTRRMGVSLAATICRFNRLKLPDGRPFLPNDMRKYLLCSEESVKNRLLARNNTILQNG